MKTMNLPEVLSRPAMHLALVAGALCGLAMMTTDAADAPAAPAAPSAPSAAVANNLLTIKSPMIGTFYRRAAPDKPLMAEEGTAVSPGKVVCIIEAMKLFNEIESEFKGTIVKVLVEDASPVEFDQPLFLVQPD